MNDASRLEELARRTLAGERVDLDREAEADSLHARAAEIRRTTGQASSLSVGF